MYTADMRPCNTAVLIAVLTTTQGKTAEGHRAESASTICAVGFQIVIAKCCTPDNTALFDKHLECLEVRGDTVGQPPSAEIRVSNMPALKAKKLGKPP